MRSTRSTSIMALALVGVTALGAGAFPQGKEFAAARDEAFTQADADGSGALSADEFTAFHEAMKSKLTAARFAHVDANGDGQVSAEELADAKPPRGGCHGKPPVDD